MLINHFCTIFFISGGVRKPPRIQVRSVDNEFPLMAPIRPVRVGVEDVAAHELGCGVAPIDVVGTDRDHKLRVVETPGDDSADGQFLLHAGLGHVAAEDDDLLD